MGKNKLTKFAEMNTFSHVFQYPWARLQEEGFPLKGKWGADFFGNDHPIVVELGCGKGEYTVGLARRHPDKNFIGIDIKGARIWSGARMAKEEGLTNVAFIRTEIESLDAFFAPGEVGEIWITFPDPQMQKTRKRLVSSRFLGLYANVLAEGGLIHLKTDSPFLYEFASRLTALNSLPVERSTADLYGSGTADPETSIKTYYEQQWLARGKTIKLISFRLPEGERVADPAEDDIPRDDYHSYSRGITQCMPEELMKLKSMMEKSL